MTLTVTGSGGAAIVILEEVIHVDGRVGRAGVATPHLVVGGGGAGVVVLTARPDAPDTPRPLLGDSRADLPGGDWVGGTGRIPP